jgi:hypothetical protein
MNDFLAVAPEYWEIALITNTTAAGTSGAHTFKDIALLN